MSMIFFIGISLAKWCHRVSTSWYYTICTDNHRPTGNTDTVPIKDSLPYHERKQP